MPANSRQFVFVRKVVINLAVKGLLKRVTETLSEMLSRCRQ